MEGEFKTVIEGTDVQSFPIRIVGVAQNFIGPERAVIFAEALDSTNLLFGGVSGMSGSPVYIDGKLIGAYAYSYNFPKEQTLIGIQPIEHMFEITEFHPPELPGMGTPRPAPMDRMEDAAVLSSDGLAKQPELSFEWVKGGKDFPAQSALQFSQLPVPVALGGFSPEVVATFQPYFDHMGLGVMQSPVGGNQEALPAYLEPGSAVAGVLMSGDFNAAGVGTVTYRDEDRILAFGHPFFQNGPTEMPMASAEIITIVQSLAQSFKLSNIGPVVGSIYQDRLTGIAGELGRMAPTTKMNIAVEAPGEIRRTYEGDLFEHRQLSPMLSAMAMMQSLFSTMESESEQTIYSEITIELEGHDPIVLKDVASGTNGPMRMVMDFYSIYFGLANNPFEFPRVESIDFNLKLEDQWNQQLLEQVIVESGEAIAGETIQVRILMRDYMGTSLSQEIQIPIPHGTEGEILEIQIGDASTANQSWSVNQNSSMFLPRPDSRSLTDIVRSLEDRQGYQALYVKVFQPGDGVRMRGIDMDNLPPSVVASIASPKTAEVMQRTSKSERWGGSFATEGEFRGRYTFRVQVRD